MNIISTRQCLLLSKLNSEKRYFTLKELSLHLNCSIKTIKRDIAIIKDSIPKEWKIEIVRRKGVILKKNTSDTSFQSDILCFKHSFLFQTLETIMEKNIKYIPDLADALYLSVSAVYPVLKQVDLYLKKYKLSLKRNPLIIEGDEIQIIFMCYELYLQAYSIKEWPFNEYSKEFILQSIQIIENTLGIQFHITSKQKISYLISIFLRRKKLKSHIYIDSGTLKYTKQSRFYNKISKAWIKILDKYQLNLTEEDIAFLTIVVECSKYIYKDAGKHIQECTKVFQMKNPTTFNLIQKIIYLLEDTFNISLIDDEKLLFLFVNFFKRTSYQLQDLSEIEDPNGITSRYIKNKYPYTFQQVKIIYSAWIKENESINTLLKKISDKDIAQITMHIEATKLFCTSNSKKVLLVSGEGDAWKQYIIALLSNQFNNRLIFIDKFITNIESETLRDIDFIITTIPLEVSCHPVIHISTIPTNRDIDTISELL